MSENLIDNGELKIKNDLSEWKEYKLEDITTKIGSGATPRGGSNSYKTEGISLIRSQNILDLKFSTNGLAFIGDTQANALKNVIVELNDVLLNITGDSVARVCKVPNYILPARVNQHVAIIRADVEKLIPDFLLYNLIAQKEELLSQSEIGATRRAITKGMIEKFIINLPPLPEQHAIASVLSSLDDKIDLLHRQNLTLEQMAETLFRQWFIEDAKEDWETKQLGEIADIKAGGDKPKVYSKMKTDLCNIPIYSNGINNEGLYGYTDIAKIDVESITISARGTIGYVCLRQEPYVPIVRLISIIPNENFISSEFLYLWAKIQNISGTGTTQQQLTVPDFSRTTLIVPPLEEMNEFTNYVNTFFIKIEFNQTQIRTLEKMRDTLLPKLMSGDIKVSIDG